jgi:exodeoxyribonuclease VII large subunit
MQFTEMEQQDIYSVSRLNNEVRMMLEESFRLVWVEGEISNFAAPHSGHWYFSLKDPQAQVRCAMFRANQRSLGFTPKDGMHVLIRARVSLYPNRGDYQLIAEVMEERGEGKLRRAYEILRKKLEDAGLFDPARKKPLPAFPKQIGVITSATGAAIRDILTVLKRRFPSLPVIIYPTLVQGESAAPAIVKAIEMANRRNECDVLILARGGGSLEDLWPFNEEILAHAIYQSQIPIISGVGHEVDFTISDYVADLRAATPSAAAEIVSPDSSELLNKLSRLNQQLPRLLQNKLKAIKQHLHWLEKHLLQQHPKRRLMEKMQRLDLCELRLITLMTNKLKEKQAKLANAADKLDALSPLATLKRGYAIASTKDGQVIRTGKEVKPGDVLDVKVMQALIHCHVQKVDIQD